VSETSSENPLTRSNFGAIVFDSIDDIDSGWCCLPDRDGGYSPKRFERYGDLQIGEGILYLTNVDYRTLEERRRVHLRADNYLRAGLGFVLEEFRIPFIKHSRQKRNDGYIIAPDNSYRPLAVKVIARVFGRVMSLAGVDGSIRTSLRHVLRARPDFPPPEPPIMDRGAWEALHRAAEEVEKYGLPIQAGGRYDRERPVIRFQRNRLEHANAVLSVPLPAFDAKWERYKGGHNLELVLKSERPMIAETRILRQPEEIGELVGLGSGDQVRRYFSQPELVFLSALDFEMEIVKVYAGSAYERNDRTRAALPSGPLSRLSFSAGLLAENIWRGRTLPGRAPGKIAKADRELKLSPAGIWIMAQDRIESFKFALEVLQLVRSHGELFESSLAGYGYGHARIRLPAGELSPAALEHIALTSYMLGAPVLGLPELDEIPVGALSQPGRTPAAFDPEAARVAAEKAAWVAINSRRTVLDYIDELYWTSKVEHAAAAQEMILKYILGSGIPASVAVLESSARNWKHGLEYGLRNVT